MLDALAQGVQHGSWLSEPLLFIWFEILFCEWLVGKYDWFSQWLVLRCFLIYCETSDVEVDNDDDVDKDDEPPPLKWDENDKMMQQDESQPETQQQQSLEKQPIVFKNPGEYAGEEERPVAADTTVSSEQP